MQATNFEFRNRWWVFGAIFGVGFFMFAFDRRPLGQQLADRLAAVLHWREAFRADYRIT
ncbi:MAG: hypothetical protein ACXWKG_20850 [Limisphaerales bacterium]